MTILLKCGDSEASVLEAGAAIGGWTWQGRQLLHAPAAPGGGKVPACFPMVPFANRIAGALLPDGEPLAVHPGEAHALHGIGWTSAWQVERRGDSSVDLALPHLADARWPFDFRATLSVLLESDRLTQVLAVTNTGACVMPCGLGLHPHFPVDDGTTLSARWNGVWDVAPDHLPTAFRPLAPSAAVAVAPWTVNNCFTGWDGGAVLAYRDYLLRIDARGTGFLQCYRPGPGSPFVAVEPVTHIPNAHHLDAAGTSSTGLHRLAPGATQAIAMTLRAGPPAG